MKDTSPPTRIDDRFVEALEALGKHKITDPAGFHARATRRARTALEYGLGSAKRLKLLARETKVSRALCVQCFEESIKILSADLKTSEDFVRAHFRAMNAIRLYRDGTPEPLETYRSMVL
tara:strand:- start:804 stop:1163 length:360 start_codon:yes stop_codon:yes gene_type:complete